MEGLRLILGGSLGVLAKDLDGSMNLCDSIPSCRGFSQHYGRPAVVMRNKEGVCDG